MEAYKTKQLINLLVKFGMPHETPMTIIEAAPTKIEPALRLKEKFGVFRQICFERIN